MFIYPNAIAKPMDVFPLNSLRISVPPTLIELYAVNTPQVAIPTKVETPVTFKFLAVASSYTISPLTFKLPDNDACAFKTCYKM